MKTLKDKYEKLFTNLKNLPTTDTRECIDILETAHSKASSAIRSAILKSHMSMAEKVRYGDLFR